MSEEHKLGCMANIQNLQGEKGKCTCDFLFPQPKEEWNERLLKLHYEPVHMEGGVCWCNPINKVIDGVLHIEHNEQRNVLKDFIRTEIEAREQELRESLIKEIENMRKERADGAPEPEGWNLALDSVIAKIKETLE